MPDLDRDDHLGAALREHAERHVPASVDLRPAVRARLAARGRGTAGAGPHRQEIARVGAARPAGAAPHRFPLAEPRQATTHPHRRPRSAALAGANIVAATALAAVFVLALALVGRGPISRRADVPPASSTPAWSSGLQTHLSTYAGDGLQFRSIDPRTLADLSDRPSLHIPGLTYGHFTSTVSADGTTIAVMQFSGALADSDDVTVRIVDARTGVDRVRFRPPFPIEMSHLSADGSRLFGWGPAYSRASPPQRLLWDTSDGRLLAVTPLSEPQDAERRVSDSAYDPEGRRVYSVAVDNASETAFLLLRDATSGKEVGRVRLDDRLAAPQPAWSPHRVVVSPGGERIAVLHADGDSLTLIDAVQLRHLWTRPLTRVPDVPDRAQPRPADARTYAPTDWIPAFSPDGRRLYTFGIENLTTGAGATAPTGVAPPTPAIRPSTRTIDETPAIRTGGTVRRQLGLRAIDLERAEIVAEVGVEGRFEGLWAAPDGSAIYTFEGRPGDRGYGGPYLLRRLDPVTLTATAEREFADRQNLVYLAERQP